MISGVSQNDPIRVFSVYVGISRVKFFKAYTSKPTIRNLTIDWCGKTYIHTITPYKMNVLPQRVETSGYTLYFEFYDPSSEGKAQILTSQQSRLNLVGRHFCKSDICI